jgi:hypothetical protein
MRLVQPVLDWEQRQRGDAKCLQMGDRLRLRQARIGAAQRLRHAGQQLAEALDVDLVQHQFATRVAWPVGGAGRRTVGSGNARLQRVRRVVTRIEGATAVGVTWGIAMLLGQPFEVADDLARAGVEQQLVRIEAQSCLRRIPSVRAQAIDQTGPGARQTTVEDTVGRPVQGVATQLVRTGGVEQAQLDRLGVLGEHCKIDAAIDHMRTEGMGLSGQQGPAR